MGAKNTEKPCGCPVIKFTGKHKGLGVLSGVCGKCRDKPTLK